jgi:hypothetical protein
VRRIEVVADPELSRLYPARFPATVVVGELTETVVDAAGDPPSGNGLAAVEQKWRGRPEDVESVRAAALDGDASGLRDALSRSV